MSNPPVPVVKPTSIPVKRLLLVLGVVATLYAAALLVWGDRPGVSLARLWSWTGLQAAALCLLNYVLRGWRWKRWMALYGRHFGAVQGLRLYLSGYAFTPTPGNVGEAVRGLMLAREPLGTAQSLAIFGAERLADLLCLLILCLPMGWWLLSRGMAQVPWLLVLMVPVVLALLIVIAVAIRQRATLIKRVGWLGEAWRCLAVQPLAWFALTLLAWAAQGAAVWLICRDLGVVISLPAAAGAYAVAMVAGALSALPAGLGGMEAVLTGLLVTHGATAALALAITVLVRLLTLWLAVGLGLMALLYSAAVARDVNLR